MAEESELLKGIRIGIRAAEDLGARIDREIKSDPDIWGTQGGRPLQEMRDVLPDRLAQSGKVEKVGAHLAASVRLGEIGRGKIAAAASQEEALWEWRKCALGIAVGSMGVGLGLEAILFAKEGPEGDEARAAARMLGLDGATAEPVIFGSATEFGRKLRAEDRLPKEGLATAGSAESKRKVIDAAFPRGSSEEDRRDLIDMLSQHRAAPMLLTAFDWISGNAQELLEEVERQARMIPEEDMSGMGRIGERLRGEIARIGPRERALLPDLAIFLLRTESEKEKGDFLARQLARSGVETPGADVGEALRGAPAERASALAALIMVGERADRPEWTPQQGKDALELLGEPGLLEKFGSLAAAKARAEGAALGEAAETDGASPKSKKRSM